MDLSVNQAFWPFFIRDYVRSELESGHEGPIYLEPLSMNRFTTALIGKRSHMSTWSYTCDIHFSEEIHHTQV